jgi:hypothetical protein
MASCHGSCFFAPLEEQKSPCQIKQETDAEIAEVTCSRSRGIRAPALTVRSAGGRDAAAHSPVHEAHYTVFSNKRVDIDDDNNDSFPTTNESRDIMLSKFDRE